MKVTNLTNAKLYLDDLKVASPSQGSGRRGEDRYLGPGASKYLLNTSEVLRSAMAGDIRGFVEAGKLKIEDVVDLSVNGDDGDTVTLTHNFNFPPGVVVLKQVNDTWVDGTGTVDIVHNEAGTTTTITNTTNFALTVMIRLI